MASLVCHLRPFIINTLSGAPITVTKTEDTFDGICDADCSLREAVGTADPGDSIDIPAGTYTLTLGSQISIDKDLILDGEGAGNTIIQAATEFGVATYRVFNIASGEVTISDVTIRHGVDGLGGAIENSGLLILASSTVSGSTGSRGGDIFNGSTLTVINSTISGNTGSSAGGGIYNQGTLTVTNSTISGNTGNANGGGGIFNGSGAATINNSTISGNTSNNVGGGINRVVGTVELINTIVAGNTGSSSPDCAGSPTYLGHNLVGHLAGCGYVAAAGDVTGTLDLALDPMLAPLQNYGGPTETHALLPGSAAIDAANPATPGSGGNACEANDQRGIPRPLGAACDIGTYEYSLILTGPTPGLAGVDNTLEVTEATPGATVTFGFGTTAGSTAIPGCPGQTVDIASPQVAGSAVADGSGNASISQTVPVTAAGKTVRLVAVQLVLQRQLV